MERNFAQTYKITSKEFWRNYWFYYKPHTLIAIAAAVIIGSSIHSCATRIDPDLTLMYIGENALYTSDEVNPEEALKAYADDADGDGNISVSLVNLSLGGDDVQMQQAAMTKYDIEVAEGNPFVAMADEAAAVRYSEMGAFECIDDMIAEYGVAEEKVLRDKEGRAIAVNVTGTAFGNIIGTGAERIVYAGIKILPERKMSNEKYMALHNEVVSFYRRLLGGEIQ